MLRNRLLGRQLALIWDICIGEWPRSRKSDILDSGSLSHSSVLNSVYSGSKAEMDFGGISTPHTRNFSVG